MMVLCEQKHLIMFDSRNQFMSSYTFAIASKSIDKGQNEDEPSLEYKDQYMIKIKIHHEFQYKWYSDSYDLSINQNNRNNFGRVPFSLETYLEIYNDPRQHVFTIRLKPNQEKTKHIGKLVIESVFRGNPFKFPIQLHRQNNMSCKKIIKIINQTDQAVLCSGNFISLQKAQKVDQFQGSQKNNQLFQIYTYECGQRVNSEQICVVRGQFQKQVLQFHGATITIVSLNRKVAFISNLEKTYERIRSVMMPENIVIVQNVQTSIQDAYQMVFYTDPSSLYQRIFRAYLYDKIEDRWLIEGMVSYNPSNKSFQECLSELSEMLQDGQQFQPLQDSTYHQDEVWRLKARFIYHILSNFKRMRDYTSLSKLIIDYSAKVKVSSSYLFRKLKNTYGLDNNFRKVYEQQFIRSTGIIKIFYNLKDNRKTNSIKIIIRQKALINKLCKLYNLFRIKLEKHYGIISPITECIIKKNKFNQNKKDLYGSLAVPEFIRSIPFCIGRVTVETDACQPFDLELVEQNIYDKEKICTASRNRPNSRKPVEFDRNYDFSWIMVDTAHIFPAIYKNENVYEATILQRVRKHYESEREEIKVLNCISSREHSKNQQLCKLLMGKIDLSKNEFQTSINVKRKILQILPMFVNKTQDVQVWEDILSLLKLYEPVCHDFSQEGYFFLLSLVECLSHLIYKAEFRYYFDEFHRIMLLILKYHRCSSEEKEDRLHHEIFRSLMKWKSTYSYRILQVVQDALEHSLTNPLRYHTQNKVILKSLLPYLGSLRIPQSKQEALGKLKNLIKKCIGNNCQLLGIQFQYQQALNQSNMNSLQFLKSVFGRLQSMQDNIQLYEKCIVSLKNILRKQKKKYGYEIQMHFNEDQSYFMAEYIWNKMASEMSLKHSNIRLNWMKIYSIFYFYYTPIITMYKLKKNLTERQFYINESETKIVLQNIMDFSVDLKWFSNYQSGGYKQYKSKYERDNNEQSRRKKKIEEFTFSKDNYLTREIKKNPGKCTWTDFMKEALSNLLITFEAREDKETDPENINKYKGMINAIKSQQNKLKRGSAPENYSFQRMERETIEIFLDYQQEKRYVEDVLNVVRETLDEIEQQRRERDKQFKLSIKDIILEEPSKGEAAYGEDEPEYRDQQQQLQ